MFVFILKLNKCFENFEHIYDGKTFFILKINNILFMYLSFFYISFFFHSKIKISNIIIYL